MTLIVLSRQDASSQRPSLCPTGAPFRPRGIGHPSEEYLTGIEERIATSYACPMCEGNNKQEGRFHKRKTPSSSSHGNSISLVALLQQALRPQYCNICARASVAIRKSIAPSPLRLDVSKHIPRPLPPRSYSRRFYVCQF